MQGTLRYIFSYESEYDQRELDTTKALAIDLYVNNNVS